MKDTGIVRRVDELGRIVLPKELRKVMSIREKDPIEIYTEGDFIILKKYKSECKCQRCGSTIYDGTRVVTDNGVTLCGNCIDWFKENV